MRKQRALLKQWGLTEQELADWKKENDVNRREAAYDELCDEELCRQLTGRLARESASRRAGDIGKILDRYEMIVTEFLAVRYTRPDGKRYSLESVLRENYESDGKLKQFLKELGEWIAYYVSRCICSGRPFNSKLNEADEVRAVASLRGCDVREQMMTALALEYVEDREGLMKFLKAVFIHWRKIFKPQSVWRVKLLTQQLAQRYGRDRRDIVGRLEGLGALPTSSNFKQFDANRARVGQILSRDQKEALKRRGV